MIGRVFEGNPGKVFEDMDPWIEEAKRGEDMEMAASN